MKKVLLLLAIGFSPVNSVSAETILYESGTLGQAAVPKSDILNGSVGGTNVTDVVFTGVRFFLDQPVITTKIGGHFVKNTEADASFFGAIISLDDENDFPDSGNLTTPDVVGTALLSFPEPSDEVFGDLAKPLDPGWYALVFGSGLFGTTGRGVAVRNGTDIDDPTYIGFQPGTDWLNISDLSSMFVDHRFVLHGSIVPEPSTVSFLFFVILAALSKRIYKKQYRFINTIL